MSEPLAIETRQLNKVYGSGRTEVVALRQATLQVPKGKVVALLGLGRQVRIVFPIPVEKWIVKVDADGVVLSRRRSPRHGSPIDVFAELVSFPELISHPNLELEVVLINEEEYRYETPGRSWRRHGWSILERRLLEVVETLPLGQLEHLTALLPAGLPELFTTADLAAALGHPRRVAQQMAYCLRKAGAIVAVGRLSQAVIYRVGPPADLVKTGADSTERRPLSKKD